MHAATGLRRGRRIGRELTGLPSSSSPRQKWGSVEERAHLAGDPLEQAAIVVVERVCGLVFDVECADYAVVDGVEKPPRR